MSLRPSDRSGRARSGSTAGGGRERSHSNVRQTEAPRYSSYPPPLPAASSPMPGAFLNEADGDSGKSATYEVRAPSYASNTADRTKMVAPPLSSAAKYAPAQAKGAAAPYPPDSSAYPVSYAPYPPQPPAPPGQPGVYYPPPPGPPPPRRNERSDESSSSGEDDLAYGDDQHRVQEREPPRRTQSYGNDIYRNPPIPAQDSRVQFAQGYDHVQPPEKVTYTTRPTGPSRPQSYTAAPQEPGRPAPYGTAPQQPPRQITYPSAPSAQFHEQDPRTYAHNSFDRDAHIVDITPGRERPDRASTGNRLSAYPEQQGLVPRMNRLSVSGLQPDPHGHQGGGGGGLPPPSPLLEAYHGTYQSISPMAMALRPDDDSDLDELSMLSPSVSRVSSNYPESTSSKHHHHDSISSSKEKKRVKVYDPESDAKSIASALNHHKPEIDIIIDLLPGLTHDQVMGVRKEYKKQVRVQGKGVNLSKHIKTKITGNFGKAVYVTTLGRWESEGYWANFWYQSHGSRRELLIESLMGRTNSEIRMIKDDFRDKRYSDSLSKCMEKELKMDKFRTAVLMALEERRQEEQDVYPQEFVHKDCDMLFRAVKAEKGGESVMLEIVVRRSDAHLREVLRTYERMYRENFARAALGKSNNLVGEVIAHILNGVINKPARDALLVQHALRDIAERNKDDALRYELLISRLVRIHWDKMHMARVKKSFYDKYKISLENAIENATKGEFRDYMCELCDSK